MAGETVNMSTVEHDDPRPAADLLPLVYDELRRLAAHRIRQERAGLTLQATSLVHEAFGRLVEGDRSFQWQNRRHFFAAAAEAMRRILIERARHHNSLKRGGGRAQIPLEDVADSALDVRNVDELLAVSDVELYRFRAEAAERLDIDMK